MTERKHFYSPCGSKIRKTFERCISPTGKKSLVQGKDELVYESIQLAAKGNLVTDLLARADRGDPNAIGKPIDSYIDLTGAPKTLAEAQQRIIDARNIYERCSAEVKRLYGNSFDNFIAAMSDGTYIADLKKRDAADKLARSNAAAAAKAAPAFTDSQIAQIKELINK